MHQGCSLYCSGGCGGEREHKGQRAVALAVAEKIVPAAAQYVSDRLLKCFSDCTVATSIPLRS